MIDARRGSASAAAREQLAQAVGIVSRGQRCAYADGIAVPSIRSQDGMRALWRTSCKAVAEIAAHPAAPRGIGQDVDRTAGQVDIRLRIANGLKVAFMRFADLPENRFGLGEFDRIGILLQDCVQGSGMNDEVVFGFAVGVVVEAFAQRLQGDDAGWRERQRFGHGAGLVGEVVAECRGNGPFPPCAAEIAVHEDAGTDVRPGIDDGLQARMRGNIRGAVVIEILDGDIAVEQGEQGRTIGVHRHVQHGDGIAGDRRHALQQHDVALDAGNAHAVDRVGEPELA